MWRKLWHPKKHTKLEIFMKSGNIIEIDDVIDWEFKSNISGVNFLRINQSRWAKYKLLVSTIDLSQIEAVVSL